MTRAQLDEIRRAFVSDVPQWSRAIAGASVNGQSFTFTHSGVEYHREEFAELLKNAYEQLDVTLYGTVTPNRTVARFD